MTALRVQIVTLSLFLTTGAMAAAAAPSPDPYADETVDVDLRPFFRDWLETTDWQRFLESEPTLGEMAETYR